MRNLTVSALCASALLLFSATTFAASEIRNDAGHQVVGQISVSGAGNVDEAINTLAKKADAAGAPYFKTTSMGGKNKLFATAELLK